MVEDMFEVSVRWPGRSCGTAGGAHSQLNRVAQQLMNGRPRLWASKPEPDEI
jgi:hypothetical protein